MNCCCYFNSIEITIMICVAMVCFVAILIAVFSFVLKLKEINAKHEKEMREKEETHRFYGDIKDLVDDIKNRFVNPNK